mgnify:CR=1 FL=1
MKKNRAEIDCKTCHKKFYVPKSVAKAYATCSKRCSSQYRSIRQKGRKITWGRKISVALTGRKLTQKEKDAMRVRLKREWQTTRKNQRTKNYPQQIAILRKRMTGKNNPMWKGKDAGKGAVHDYFRTRIKKPDLCPRCRKAKPYDLANLTEHKYKRQINDFMWLCRRCHMQLDNRKPPQHWLK